MMYLTLLSVCLSTAPSSSVNSVVMSPKDCAVLVIWVRNRWAGPMSKLISRLVIESMIRLPPFCSWADWPISLPASAISPDSWLSYRLPDIAYFSCSVEFIAVQE